MKILATSDMHGNLAGLDLSGIDIAVFAGDIAPLKGRGAWHIYDQVKWIRKKFTEWCKQWPKTEIVFVPGNHDFFPIAGQKFKDVLAGKNLKLNEDETSSDMFGSSNMHMLIDEMIEINGVKIYGTPWVPIISFSWAFEAEDELQQQKFKDIPQGLDVLVTHSPPRFNLVDVSLEHGIDSTKFGSSILATEIVKKEPKLAFCGHIHSGDHTKNILGKTNVYNVSRVDERYDIAYEPTIIEL